MLTFTDQEFRDSIAAETGVRPSWASEAFSDLEADVRQSIARILAEPSIPLKDSVRGFVYDVKTGKLNEVKPS
jgi:carbonic anhydrase